MPESKPTPPRVLVIDDDAELVDILCEGLADAGYDARGCSAAGEALGLVEQEPFDAVVTDLRMPGCDGMKILHASRRADPERPIIVMTAFSAIDTAIESIRQGAYHYLTKPFKVDELALFLDRAFAETRLRQETKALRRALGTGSLRAVVGRDGGMREVCALVARVADADAPVLLLGETGSGKGLIARALHDEGRRSRGPLVTVNCAALPEQLLESELFGHARGAFTGAMASRRGLIEEANGGTLFLDEIGEMPVALQAKLLRVVEQNLVRAVGSNKEIEVDVRFVAATHRDLQARVVSREFREDLLFRLNVVSIEIPALRHRAQDIPALIEHFLDHARHKHPRSRVIRLAPEVVERLCEYAWPGNVRELENTVERLVLLAPGPDVTIADLPPTFAAAKAHDLQFSGPVLPLAEVARRYAAWAFERLEGRRMLTAEKLGVDRKTLVKLLGPRSDPADG